MTTTEEHKEIIKEFLDDINEKIRSGLITERQKIIRFSASEAATNLFAILLHSKNLIEPSYNINHRFFASKRIAENKFPQDFAKKEKIINLMVKQEEYRIKLCYGKKKTPETANSAIKNLFELKETIQGELKNE
jgi:hypothetical protein